MRNWDFFLPLARGAVGLNKPNAFSIEVFSFIVLWTLRLYIVLFIEAANPFGFASDEAAVQKYRYRSKLDPSFSDLDLPFAKKLYYSMSTISYTPWFSYQINMTLIGYSRIHKDRSLAEATRHRAAMTACPSLISTSGSP